MSNGKKVTVKKPSKPVETKAGFSLVVGSREGIGTYKDGDTLTVERHVADYLRQHFDSCRITIQVAPPMIGNNNAGGPML